MPRRRKGAVRTGHGAMCNICGKNCGKGGALRKHVEGAHDVRYEDYRICFYNGGAKKVITDAWDDSVSTSGGRAVVMHVLVRRFVRERARRGVTRSVPQRV